MTKSIRPWRVDEIWLLPPSVQDFVPAGHPALILHDFRGHPEARFKKVEAMRLPAPSASKLLPVPTADQAAEIARLRRERDRLRMERAIP